MNRLALFLLTLSLFAPCSANALKVPEFKAQSKQFMVSFLIGAIDMAALISSPERNACILKWFTSDSGAATQEFFDAIAAQHDPTYNAAGVLIDVILKHCGIGGDEGYPPTSRK